MTAYSDESSMDDDSLHESRPYNRKALERKLSTFDDQFGGSNGESSQVLTATTGSSTVLGSSGLNDSDHSNDSLYFDVEAEKKKKKKQTKKVEPSFNQSGALEILMSPPAKKKASAAAAAMVLPKSIAKGKKETSGSSMSSKVASTLDKLGSESKKKTSRHSLKSKSGDNDKATVDEMWDLLGKGSGHGANHNRSKSITMTDLTDSCGFIVEPGSPGALSSSAHRNNNSAGEIGRSSRRGGRRNGNGMGSSSHQKGGPTDAELTVSPAARKGAIRRRRDQNNQLRSSSHGPGDRLGSSSHGPGDRVTAQSPGPGTPRSRNRSMGKLAQVPAMETQSAHVSTDTPVKRRMRRRGSGSMGPPVDLPFSSPGSGSKEAVNAADFLSVNKGVMSPSDGGKRPMRGRRPSQRGGDDLKSPSDHNPRPVRNGSIKSAAGRPQRNGSTGTRPMRNGSIQSVGGTGGRRRRSRDPALVNAGVPQA
ncbi:unnamed protein product [Cylindrotheca closterium]|uniref:Uncharacterized protein n=1 Tax=Cylindrotheca closterium TaxID=2856 RepID=A0AAD2CU63_9STRA|nr:unnamed protein product [Cylindrotheca closterium]